LLFDSGLQFRPTSSRRKRDQAELYWTAVTRELKCRCTCIIWDELGRILPEPVCVCRDFRSPPTYNTAVILLNFRGKTLRTASRIRHLFSELLEVLLSAIQPLPYSILNSTVRPASFQPALDKLTSQASHIRSILDPDLIQQEIYHGVWDALGLFQVLGETLKCHCAPMRDRNIEAMIQTAQSCVDGRNAVSLTGAIRMCFDVLEFMKLASIYFIRSECFSHPHVKSCHYRTSQTTNYKTSAPTFYVPHPNTNREHSKTRRNEPTWILQLRSLGYDELSLNSPLLHDPIQSTPKRQRKSSVLSVDPSKSTSSIQGSLPRPKFPHQNSPHQRLVPAPNLEFI